MKEKTKEFLNKHPLRGRVLEIIHQALDIEGKEIRKEQDKKPNKTQKNTKKSKEDENTADSDKGSISTNL